MLYKCIKVPVLSCQNNEKLTRIITERKLLSQLIKIKEK